MTDLPTVEELEALSETNPALFEAITKKLQIQKEERETPKYVEALFTEQYEFFRDPAPKKAAVCSRRAGKTEGAAAWLLEGSRGKPGGTSLYIALSRNNCRMIMWKTLAEINQRHDLGLRFTEQDNQLKIFTPNGHEIWLAGCKDSAEIEKFRGMKFVRVVIDEAASFGEYIRQLIYDVLEPALLDLKGELAIIGTPGVIPAGLFYEATTGKGNQVGSVKKWSTHSWTVIDNPFVPHAEQWLDEKRESNGWGVDNPTYRREWLGQWIRDEGALVFPYDPKINSCYSLPEGDDTWTYALGIDVGYKDSSAFVVGAFRRNHPEVYIIEVHKKEGMIPSAVAAFIEKLKSKYDIWNVIMDTGGIGKGYAEECSQRYQIHIEPAEKTKKRAFLEIVRGEIMSGVVKFMPRPCEPLLLEMQALVWDEKHEAPDDRFENHAADALLYLVRGMMPFYRPQRVAPTLTPRQQVDKEMAEHKRSCMERQQARMQKSMRRGQAYHEIASGK